MEIKRINSKVATIKIGRVMYAIEAPVPISDAQIKEVGESLFNRHHVDKI